MVVRITLKDVARASGVSPTTVSFVLNNTPGQTIPELTRQRVRQSATELGYLPHSIARALREGRSRVVLLTTGRWRGGQSLDSFIAGVSGELRARGHNLVVHYGEQSDESLAELLEAVSPRAVLDLAGADLGQEGSDWTDGLAPATAAQLRHLVDRGHTAIALALPSGDFGALVEIRLSQSQRAAEALGIPPVTPVVVGQSRAEAREAMRWLRHEHPGITAVAGFDDDTALLAMGALADAGVAIPDTMAVIGFDDARHGAIWTPALTSVHIDAEAYGRRAACAALGIEPEEWTGDPSYIVLREST